MRSHFLLIIIISYALINLYLCILKLIVVIFNYKNKKKKKNIDDCKERLKVVFVPQDFDNSFPLMTSLVLFKQIITSII